MYRSFPWLVCINSYHTIVLPGGRYDTIDCFISESALMQDKYNDLPLVIAPDALEVLLKNGAHICASSFGLLLVYFFGTSCPPLGAIAVSLSQALMSGSPVTLPTFGFATPW